MDRLEKHEGGTSLWGWPRQDPIAFVDPFGRSGEAGTLSPGDLAPFAPWVGPLLAAGGEYAVGAAVVGGIGFLAYELAKYPNSATGASGPVHPPVGDSAGGAYGSGSDSVPAWFASTRGQAREGANQEECDKEWEDAEAQCAEWIADPRSCPAPGLTGGYTNVYDCARGLVTEECGGNPTGNPRPDLPLH
jgi:hypothetical protein